MKKRTIIAIIITIVVLFLTNKYWLVFRPMPVDFDISGNGECNIEVQLNKKDNDKFDKIKSENILFDLDKHKHAKFSAIKAKQPKRIRIIFSCQNKLTPITISNIQLRDGKLKLTDLSKFSTPDGKLIIKDNKIELYPADNVLTLNYGDTLKIRSAVKFNFEIFVIILVLTFLFSYKISNYIADFKTIKNKSRIDIIFLTIFFIFLFIPMLHINQDEYSTQENRALAKWKPFIQEGQINFNFGKDFNEWFNDRFNLRKNLLDVYTIIAINTNGKLTNGLVDKNGFIYWDLYLNHKNLKTIDKEDFQALIDFNRFCKKNNIELYTLVVPNKADIYPTSKNLLLNDNSIKKFSEKINYLNEKENMHIIHPLSELQKSSDKNYMFFKTEHHWTDDGAFVGYKALMKEISKKYNNINILDESSFDFSYNKLVRAEWYRTYDYGQFSWKFNLPQYYIKKYHQTDYRYFTHKNVDKLNITEIYNTKTFYYPLGANYRVVQFGTSQNENLTEFIPYTFKNVKHIRNNWGEYTGEKEFKIMKYFAKDILAYKPDIIIFCITYDNLAQMHNFDKE